MTLTPRTWARMTLRSLPGGVLGLAMMLVVPVAGLAQAGAPGDSGHGGDHAVVLELYTAQGCASCPPADAMLEEIATRDDVIALALHVDYWDYIGWVDTFADPEHGQRQQRYARRYGYSTVYTPQVVINGVDIIEGYRVMQVMEAIAMQQRREAQAVIELQPVEGGGLDITARALHEPAPLVAMASRRSAMTNGVVGTLSMGDEPGQAVAAPSLVVPQEMADEGGYSVQVVRYRAEDQVEIMAGENAGRAARFVNIVTGWQVVGTWDMLHPLQITIPFEGPDPVVVIIQEAGQGEIIAAARLR